MLSPAGAQQCGGWPVGGGELRGRRLRRQSRRCGPQIVRHWPHCAAVKLCEYGRLLSDDLGVISQLYGIPLSLPYA